MTQVLVKKTESLTVKMEYCEIDDRFTAVEKLIEFFLTHDMLNF